MVFKVNWRSFTDWCYLPSWTTYSLTVKCFVNFVCHLSFVFRRYHDTWFRTIDTDLSQLCLTLGESLNAFLANVNSSSCSLYVIVRPSVCRLSSVTLVHPTQAIEIFGNVSTPFGTLAIHYLCVKILRRSFPGNPSGGGLNRRGVAKYSDSGPFQGYISETVQDRR